MHKLENRAETLEMRANILVDISQKIIIKYY